MNIARTLTVMALLGCGSSPDALKAKEDAAEASYAAALLRCVDKAKTLEESHACRDKVRLEWNVVETVTDGGAR